MVQKSLSLTLGQSFEHITLYTYNGAAIFFGAIPIYGVLPYSMIYICPSRFGPLGAPRDSKWRLLLFCGRRFRSCSARRVTDMDKSTTSFIEERLTAAPRLVQFV